MSKSATERWMRRAISLSRRGFPAPNPHVGCVIVANGEVIGEGYHHHAGGPHAEVVAMRKAGDKAKGADVYVTLEPCNHQGRTGPCSEALIAAKVKKVFIAACDPNPRAEGGIERLVAAGIEVESGVLIEEAREANLPWLVGMERRRPFVAVKAAITLDGKIARPNGDSKWITGPEARRSGHRLRAAMGAVLVGRGTVEKDDPLLTARIPGVVNQPMRVVLDPEAKLSGEYKVFGNEAKTIHVVGPGKIGHGELINCPLSSDEFDLTVLLQRLFELGQTSLLVEGGASTIGSFVAADLVDRIDLYIAPTIFGDGINWIGAGANAITNERDVWIIRQVERFGLDVRLSLARKLQKD